MKVVIAEKIAAAGVEALAEHCETIDAVDYSRPQLIEAVADASALVVRSATEVDADLIAAAPQLRVIGRAGIGTDNIDLDAATYAGILVVNAPMANTVSAAEHTLALLLAQARNVPAADRSLRAGNWDRKQYQGIELHGKVLGIVGLGRIGTLVARRARAFGMRVLAYDPYVTPDRAASMGVELEETLEAVLAQADFITVHLPLTRDTEHLFDADAFSRMKDGARIVNTSRGGVIDEEALADAVAAGKIGGAALDVFANEPLGESRLRDLPQVVLTPHLGAATQEAQDKAGIDVAKAVAAALAGDLVPNAVNVDMGPEVSDEVMGYVNLAEDLGRLFVAMARGVPSELIIRSEGRLSEEPMRPLVLATLRGVLASVSDEPVSFVNAPLLAESRGMSVTEELAHEAADFVSLVRISGMVGDELTTVAGTVIHHKGPSLVSIGDTQLEVPLARYLLIISNDDVPGVIGRVGTFLGSAGVNISDMAVGRNPGGEAAMMGITVDSPVDDSLMEGLREVGGVNDARFVAF